MAGKSLGKLCKYNHDHENTGQSLWYISCRGYRTSCVVCAADTHRRNPHVRRAAAKASRVKDPARARAYGKAWYAENRESQCAKRKEYRAARTDQIREQVGRWQRTVAGKRRIAEAQFRRLQILLSMPCTVTDEYLVRLLEHCENKCPSCGVDFTNTRGAAQQCWDHDVPISRGGADANENMIPLCRSCNSSKRQQTFEQWKGRPFIRPE
jgi:5-methylcytosine-specific restriction endonuclease McrA